MSDNSAKEKFSVIIRCKNEERWIGHTIQSVVERISDAELIIVDNNSTDASLEIVRSFQSDPTLLKGVGSEKYTDIKIVNIDDYSPGRALNLGVSKASASNILIISSHCVLTRFDIATHLRDLERHDAIFGDQQPVYNGKKITKRYMWSNFIDTRSVNLYSDHEGRYFFHNALSIFRKNTLVEHPFNETLTGKEDRYWAVEMVEQHGAKILYDPALSADHHYTPNGNTWKGIG